MKKGLLIFQALTIALAVLVSFGNPMADAKSTYTDSTQSIPADLSTAGPGAQAMDCGEHKNACNLEGGQHSQVNECCGSISQAPVRGPAISLDMAWRGASKFPPAFAFGPPARPPRIFA